MDSKGLAVTPQNLPVPADPAEDCTDDCRLWIGNVDTRLTEYSLLKILQKYGELKRFDFLLNKTGPEIGKPRGYCFVSYNTRQDAERAKKCLHGKLALSKRLLVKWANVEKETTDKTPSDTSNQGSISSQNMLSTESKIKAIEAKLKQLEETKTEFTPTPKLMAPPGSSSLSAVNIVSANKQTNSYTRKPYNSNSRRR